MWRTKTPRANTPERLESGWIPPAIPKPKDPIEDMTRKTASSTAASQTPAVLGRSLAVRGELSGNEDLLIEGQFDGTINFQDRCVTVAPHARVKASIRARRAVIHGSLSGNISAREKIEVRKTASVTGDLVTEGIAIEDGASFKGSIELIRDETPEVREEFSSSSAGAATGDEPEGSLAASRGSA